MKFLKKKSNFKDKSVLELKILTAKNVSIKYVNWQE